MTKWYSEREAFWYYGSAASGYYYRSQTNIGKVKSFVGPGDFQADNRVFSSIQKYYKTIMNKKYTEGVW